jgi:hypothetical protein
MAWYKKDMSFADPSNAKYFGGVGKAIAGAGKAAFKLGDDMQKRDDIQWEKTQKEKAQKIQQEKHNMEKGKVNFDRLEKMKTDKAKVSMMDRHIKSIGGDPSKYSFEEKLIGGNEFDQLHTDKSAYKYNKSYMLNGQIIGEFRDGKGGVKHRSLFGEKNPSSTKPNIQNIKNEDGTTTMYEVYTKDGKSYRREVKNYAPPTQFDDIDINTKQKTTSEKSVFNGDKSPKKERFNLDTKDVEYQDNARNLGLRIHNSNHKKTHAQKQEDLVKQMRWR